jgi:hypothetical protein
MRIFLPPGICNKKYLNVVINKIKTINFGRQYPLIYCCTLKVYDVNFAACEMPLNNPKACVLLVVKHSSILDMLYWQKKLGIISFISTILTNLENIQT